MASDRRDPVRQRVAEELRAALIAGDLESGRVYSAPALGARLGVSATPVREAMQDLARDGMVEVVPNTGFRVTEVSQVELDQLAELRLLIEVPIMGHIAEHLAADDESRVEALREFADSMIDAGERSDMVDYMAADTEFHSRFLELYGNPEIVRVVRQARERSRLFGLLPLAQSGHLTVMTTEHHGMIDAALARDRTAMESLVTQHIQHVRREWATGVGDA